MEKKKKFINGQLLRLLTVLKNYQKENVIKTVKNQHWLMPLKERFALVWTKIVEKDLFQIRET